MAIEYDIEELKARTRERLRKRGYFDEDPLINRKYTGPVEDAGEGIPTDVDDAVHMEKARAFADEFHVAPRQRPEEAVPVYGGEREWADYAKALGSGAVSVGEAAAGVFELGARGLEATGIPLVEDLGGMLKEHVFQPAREGLGEVREDIRGGMTARAQEGLSREFFSTGENSIWRNLSDVPMYFMEQIPMAAVTLIPVFKASSLASAAVRGAVTEGGLTSGFVFSEIAKEIDTASTEDMYSSDSYRELRAEGVSDADARDAVKTLMGGIAVAAGAVSATTGALGGSALKFPKDLAKKFLPKAATLQRVFQGNEQAARGFFRRFIQGYVTEAGQEATQESIEQLSQNLAAKVTHDPDRDIYENVAEAAVAGGFLGGIFGGIFGVLSQDAPSQAEEWVEDEGEDDDDDPSGPDFEGGEGVQFDMFAPELAVAVEQAKKARDSGKIYGPKHQRDITTAETEYDKAMEAQEKIRTILQTEQAEIDRSAPDVEELRTDLAALTAKRQGLREKLAIAKEQKWNKERQDQLRSDGKKYEADIKRVKAELKEADAKRAAAIKQIRGKYTEPRRLAEKQRNASLQRGRAAMSRLGAKYNAQFTARAMARTHPTAPYTSPEPQTVELPDGGTMVTGYAPSRATETHPGQGDLFDPSSTPPVQSASEPEQVVRGGPTGIAPSTWAPPGALPIGAPPSYVPPQAVATPAPAGQEGIMPTMPQEIGGRMGDLFGEPTPNVPFEPTVVPEETVTQPTLTPEQAVEARNRDIEARRAAAREQFTVTSERRARGELDLEEQAGKAERTALQNIHHDVDAAAPVQMQGVVQEALELTYRDEVKRNYRGSATQKLIGGTFEGVNTKANARRRMQELFIDEQSETVVDPEVRQALAKALKQARARLTASEREAVAGLSDEQLASKSFGERIDALVSSERGPRGSKAETARKDLLATEKQLNTKRAQLENENLKPAARRRLEKQVENLEKKLEGQQFRNQALIASAARKFRSVAKRLKVEGTTHQDVIAAAYEHMFDKEINADLDADLKAKYDAREIGKGAPTVAVHDAASVTGRAGDLGFEEEGDVAPSEHLTKQAEDIQKEVQEERAKELTAQDRADKERRDAQAKEREEVAQSQERQSRDVAEQLAALVGIKLQGDLTEEEEEAQLKEAKKKLKEVLGVLSPEEEKARLEEAKEKLKKALAEGATGSEAAEQLAALVGIELQDGVMGNDITDEQIAEEAAHKVEGPEAQAAVTAAEKTAETRPSKQAPLTPTARIVNRAKKAVGRLFPGQKNKDRALVGLVANLSRAYTAQPDLVMDLLRNIVQGIRLDIVTKAGGVALDSKKAQAQMKRLNELADFLLVVSRSLNGAVGGTKLQKRLAISDFIYAIGLHIEQGADIEQYKELLTGKTKAVAPGHTASDLATTAHRVGFKPDKSEDQARLSLTREYLDKVTTAELKHFYTQILQQTLQSTKDADGKTQQLDRDALIAAILTFEEVYSAEGMSPLQIVEIFSGREESAAKARVRAEKSLASQPLSLQMQIRHFRRYRTTWYRKNMKKIPKVVRHAQKMLKHYIESGVVEDLEVEDVAVRTAPSASGRGTALADRRKNLFEFYLDYAGVNGTEALFQFAEREMDIDTSQDGLLTHSPRPNPRNQWTKKGWYKTVDAVGVAELANLMTRSETLLSMSELYDLAYKVGAIPMGGRDIRGLMSRAEVFAALKEGGFFEASFEKGAQARDERLALRQPWRPIERQSSTELQQTHMLRFMAERVAAIRRLISMVRPVDLPPIINPTKKELLKQKYAGKRVPKFVRKNDDNASQSQLYPGIGKEVLLNYQGSATQKLLGSGSIGKGFWEHWTTMLSEYEKGFLYIQELVDMKDRLAATEGAVKTGTAQTVTIGKKGLIKVGTPKEVATARESLQERLVARLSELQVVQHQMLRDMVDAINAMSDEQLQEFANKIGVKSRPIIESTLAEMDKEGLNRLATKLNLGERYAKRKKWSASIYNRVPRYTLEPDIVNALMDLPAKRIMSLIGPSTRQGYINVIMESDVMQSLVALSRGEVVGEPEAETKTKAPTLLPKTAYLGTLIDKLDSRLKRMIASDRIDSSSKIKLESFRDEMFNLSMAINKAKKKLATAETYEQAEEFRKLSDRLAAIYEELDQIPLIHILPVTAAEVTGQMLTKAKERTSIAATDLGQAEDKQRKLLDQLKKTDIGRKHKTAEAVIQSYEEALHRVSQRVRDARRAAIRADTLYPTDKSRQESVKKELERAQAEKDAIQKDWIKPARLAYEVSAYNKLIPNMRKVLAKASAEQAQIADKLQHKGTETAVSRKAQARAARMGRNLNESLSRHRRFSKEAKAAYSSAGRKIAQALRTGDAFIGLDKILETMQESDSPFIRNLSASLAKQGLDVQIRIATRTEMQEARARAKAALVEQIHIGRKRKDDKKLSEIRGARIAKTRRGPRAMEAAAAPGFEKSDRAKSDSIGRRDPAALTRSDIRHYEARDFSTGLLPDIGAAAFVQEGDGVRTIYIDENIVRLHQSQPGVLESLAGKGDRETLGKIKLAESLGRPDIADASRADIKESWDAVMLGHAVLHEIVHAGTVATLNNNPGLRTEITRMMDVVRAWAENTGYKGDLPYGMNSVEDFVAEAFSNAEFQEFLDGIEDLTGATGYKSKFPLEEAGAKKPIKSTLTKRTLLQKLADALSAIFLKPGQRIKKGHLFETVLRLQPEIFAGDEKLAQQWAAHRPGVYNLAADAALTGGINSARGTIEKILRWGKINKLGLLTLNQIVDSVGHWFDIEVDGQVYNPLKESAWLLHAKWKHIYEQQEMVDDNLAEWALIENLDHKHDLNLLMAYATYYGVHPDLPIDHELNIHLTSALARQHYTRISKMYKALQGKSQEAIDVYHLIKDTLEDAYNKRVETVKKNVLDGGGFDNTEAVDVSNPETIRQLKRHGKVIEDDEVRFLKDVLTPRRMEKGPYFPIKRFGDLATWATRTETRSFATTEQADTFMRDQDEFDRSLRVTKEAQADGTFQVTVIRRHFSNHELGSDGDRSIREYEQWAAAEKSDPNVTWEHSLEPEVADKVLQMKNLPTKAFREALEKRFSGNPRLYKAALDAMIDLMPETSLRKHELPRTNMQGYSTDMQRAYAAYARSSAYNDAQLLYGHKIGDAVNEMDRVAKAAGEMRPRMREVVKEMREQDANEEIIRNPGMLTRGLAKFGFLWFLTTPSYWAINMTQPFALGIPYMNARLGRGATRELLKAMRDIGPDAARLAKDTGLGVKTWTDPKATRRLYRFGREIQQMLKDKKFTDEAKMLEELSERGLIDMSFAMAVREIAEGSDPNAISNKILHVARAMPHIIEVVNRTSVGVAAYRMARNKGQSHEEAIETAYDVVDKTQFDYSPHNRSRLFQNELLRPMLMFKMHPQNVYYTMGKAVWDMVQGEPDAKVQGAKIFAGVMGMHAVMGGAVAATFEPIKWAIGAFAALGQAIDDDDSDDEPIDVFGGDWFAINVERGLSGFIENEAVRTALARGVPAALGADISGRVSLSNLLFMGRNQANQYISRDSMAANLLAIAGPIGSTVGNVADGIGRYQKTGDVRHIIKGAAPKLLRDVYNTYEISTKGVLAVNGDPLMAPEELSPFEYFSLSMGFSPSSRNEMYLRRNAVKRVEGMWGNRRGKLRRQWLSADAVGKGQIMQQIREYNAQAPQSQLILPSQLISAVKDKIRRQALTKHGRGVYLPLSRQDLAKYGDFSHAGAVKRSNPRTPPIPHRTPGTTLKPRRRRPPKTTTPISSQPTTTGQSRSGIPTNDLPDFLLKELVTGKTKKGTSYASQLAIPFLVDWELSGAKAPLTVERLPGDDKSELTVGAGHLVTPEDKLKAGDKITKEMARDFFVADLKKAEVQAAKDAGPAWDSYNDNEKAAIIAATLNIGSHDKGWEATRHLRNGNMEGYLDEMYNPKTRRGVVHNTIDGVKYRLLGLERRRLAERLLAQGKDPQSARQYLLGERDRVQVGSPNKVKLAGR